MLERGLTDDTMNVLKSVMNPAIVAFIEGTGGDLRKSVLDKLTPQITASLEKNFGEVVVYEQTRSILGSVRRLYEVGSPVPATLILLFSVIVPFVKAALVAWAVPHGRRSPPATHACVRRDDRQVVDGRRLRRRAVHRVSGGARQRHANPGTGAVPALIAFSAHFGAGFYWFAAYCLFSLASQQITARLAMKPMVPAQTPVVDTRNGRSGRTA